LDSINNNDNEINKNIRDKHPFRILLVDDEPDIISVTKRGLQSNGFEVDAFTDPAEALSNFKTAAYDLLLLDVKMPKINGFELYRHISKIDDKIKVCFMSAFESYAEEFKKAFPNQSESCFTRKPISIDELAKRIKEQLLEESR
jgi:two-component system, OmpR family, response regulator ChvI